MNQLEELRIRTVVCGVRGESPPRLLPPPKFLSWGKNLLPLPGLDDSRNDPVHGRFATSWDRLTFEAGIRWKKEHLYACSFVSPGSVPGSVSFRL